ncbi:MAG: hypothetical protein RML72_09145 [Bacteroidia bacterium]|nr:hypothetical protein [Bacteroidia bacterium]MDW8159022.1 hypothetical protein [Bacteroidia bacterium]
MKTIFALILLIGLKLQISAQNQSISALDEKYAFRDIAFESKVSENANFTFLKTDENNKDIKIYRRASDKGIEIGSAKIKTIDYHFYKDKFYMVVIETEKGKNNYGEKNADLIIRSLVANYGQAHATEDKVVTQQYIWRGEKTYIEAIQNVTGTTKVIIKSLIVENEINRDKQNRVTNSSKDW